MNNLSLSIIEKARESLRKYGRGLENAQFNLYFEDAPQDQVIYELKKFQNEDGGFGNGLEPDFRLPDSSAAATAFGLRILSSLDQNKEVKSLVKSSIQYLEDSFDEDRPGWYNVPQKVNDYPHAQWWTVDKKTGTSGLDHYWGNPNAELLGYVHKYNGSDSDLDLEHLLDYAVNHYQRSNKDDIHELYAYIHLYKNLPEEKQEELFQHLILAVGNLVSININEWDQYVPKPLDIVQSPDDPMFGLYEQSIEENLDFLANKLADQGYITPSWSWSRYEDVWKNARNEWIGILTLKSLRILQNFDRLA